MSPMTEVDLLGEAIAGTEREIFGEAVGQEPQELSEGDKSLEEMEEVGQEDAEAEAEAETGQEDAGDEAEGDESDAEDDQGEEQEERARDERGRFTTREEQPEQQRQEQPEPRRSNQRVPVSELIEERRARQAAEAQNTQLNSQLSTLTQTIANMNARLDAIAAERRGNNAPQQQPQVSPDLDPDTRFLANPSQGIADLRTQMLGEVEQRIQNARVEDSFARTYAEHGQAFESAYKTLTSMDPQDPVARATVQRIVKSPMPGKALMDWHMQQEISREVAGDPAAYRQRIRDEERRQLLDDPEFRQQIIEQMRGDARGNPSVVRGAQGAQRPARRGVPSLSEATGHAQRIDPDEYDDSDRAAFDFAWR